MFASLVYVLCTVTSASCAWLLYAKYKRTKVRLLAWSAACFTGLALNNALLFIDLVMVPSVDLAFIRTLPAVIGFCVLIWGCVWDMA